MADYNYITASDINSSIITNFDITPYLEEANDEVEDLAERKGVRDTSSITIPLHHTVRRYATLYLQMRLAEDHIGAVDEDVSMDKYDRLNDIYTQKLKELYTMITYQMITGTVNSIGGRVSTFNIYRA